MSETPAEPTSRSQRILGGKRDGIRQLVFHENVRLKTIDVLARIKPANLENILLSAVRDPGFATRSDREKLQTISTLGRVTTNRAISIFREIAFGSKTLKVDLVTRVEAIRILGSTENPHNTESLSALQKLSKGLIANKDIKKAASKAIKNIRHRKASYERR